MQGDTTKQAQVAEVQVFGSGAVVENGSVTPDPTYTDCGHDHGTQPGRR